MRCVVLACAVVMGSCGIAWGQFYGPVSEQLYVISEPMRATLSYDVEIFGYLDLDNPVTSDGITTYHPWSSDQDHFILYFRPGALSDPLDNFDYSTGWWAPNVGTLWHVSGAGPVSVSVPEGSPAPPRYTTIGWQGSQTLVIEPGTYTLGRNMSDPKYTGNYNRVLFSVTFTPIPEPSTLALSLAGVVTAVATLTSRRTVGGVLGLVGRPLS